MNGGEGKRERNMKILENVLFFFLFYIVWMEKDFFRSPMLKTQTFLAQV